MALLTNGLLEKEVEFAREGEYVLSVRARGTPLGGVYPTVEVRIDGETRDVIELTSEGWRDYRAVVEVGEGLRRIGLAFVNDAHEPPEDRNLVIGRMTISLR